MPSWTESLEAIRAEIGAADKAQQEYVEEAEKELKKIDEARKLIKNLWSDGSIKGVD